MLDMEGSMAPMTMPSVEDPAGRRTPLPTRVSRACERCRRNKSRCDAYRPCSLCLRANAKCVPAGSRGEGSPSRGNAVTNPRSAPRSGDHFSTAPSKRRWDDTGLSPPTSAPSRKHRLSDASQESSPHNSSQTPGSVYDDHSDSAITIAQKIHRLDSQPFDDRAIDAIPGADVGFRRREFGSISQATRVSTASLLKHPLPDEAVMVTLIEEYFNSVHWFSLVILEAKFRPAFQAVRTGSASLSERQFLLLLSTVLGLAAWYRGRRPHQQDGYTAEFWQDWSSRLLENSESQIIDIMNQNSIPAIQTMILLGSYYVYHGRPNLSFSLLGGTVKAAQAAGLHREAIHGSTMDLEERKRVWWTIYTWDRFASITYGRPLSINDKDCNVSQGQDVSEDPSFSESPNPDLMEPVCFSAYQRELNKLYRIASPAIKHVYSAPQPANSNATPDHLSLVKDVTIQLWIWRRSLPKHLLLRMDKDCPSTLSVRLRAHYLQSLSLQLTFDSLIIVLHRPFIKQSLDSMNLEASGPQSASARAEAFHLSHPKLDRRSPSVASDASLELDTSSHQQWWEAAVRTSRVTELPQLAQYATDSHLVAFMAINLFNAALVMIVVALSDPLTNSAQEAKRAVARIYRLQETLESRSTLSEQSSRVLRSLIQLLLRRESDAILAPVAQREMAGYRDDTSQVSQLDPTHISVRDALSIPLGARFDTNENENPSQAKNASGLASRLNHSLATLQKAFTAGTDQTHGANPPLGSNRATPDRQLEAGVLNTFDSEANIMDLSDVNLSIADWNSGNTSSDNGLYWFWDPTWDFLDGNLHL